MAVIVEPFFYLPNLLSLCFDSRQLTHAIYFSRSRNTFYFTLEYFRVYWFLSKYNSVFTSTYKYKPHVFCVYTFLEESIDNIFYFLF